MAYIGRDTVAVYIARQRVIVKINNMVESHLHSATFLLKHGQVWF